ncbi:hypothetical protein [Rhodanobacter lindaniclasticus]
MRASSNVFVTREWQSAIGNPGAHLRFLFLPTREASDRHAAYHQHLVRAEILLARIAAARTTGLRAVPPRSTTRTKRVPRSNRRATCLPPPRWSIAAGMRRTAPREPSR